MTDLYQHDKHFYLLEHKLPWVVTPNPCYLHESWSLHQWSELSGPKSFDKQIASLLVPWDLQKLSQTSLKNSVPSDEMLHPKRQEKIAGLDTVFHYNSTVAGRKYIYQHYLDSSSTGRYKRFNSGCIISTGKFLFFCFSSFYNRNCKKVFIHTRIQIKNLQNLGHIINIVVKKCRSYSIFLGAS